MANKIKFPLFLFLFCIIDHMLAKFEKFEKNFSKFIGHKYSVAVSSGTAALDIAVKSLNLKKNDEIHAVPVELGLVGNEGLVEIISGLNEGDIIIPQES